MIRFALLVVAIVVCWRGWHSAMKRSTVIATMVHNLPAILTV